MSGGVNKVIVIGTLGRDPDIRSTNDGRQIANLSVATSEHWKDKNTGERREKTEWHRVTIFNDRLAKVAADYLRKGSRVYIEGQLQTRKWTDQQGVERYTTEIVLSQFRGDMQMLSERKNGDQSPRDPQAPPRQNNDDPRTQRADLDDDIPF